ncbi:hypothetical protein [Arthrobacter sp. NPDC056727]|uniref:hypothetical protein n=1 Tax=Arthrobacter sp. NPDC056727 TaxID=3345927 RepID=UPI00366A6FCA
MRVAKSDIIAGLPATVARSLVRLYQGGASVQETADNLLRKSGIDDGGAVFARLEAAGYLAKSDVDDDGYVWWEATILGNALAMASFGKPTSRKTADRLVAGLLERAHHYNAEPGRPLFIARLRLFGSYLKPEIDPLGDVDVELSYGSRITDPAAVREYTKARGQTSLSYIDQLFWPQKELVQYLRNRSTALNITLQDIDQFTDTSEVLYRIDSDSDAEPPPSEGNVAGKV